MGLCQKCVCVISVIHGTKGGLIIFIDFAKEIVKMYFTILGATLSLFELGKTIKDYFPENWVEYYLKNEELFLKISFMYIPLCILIIVFFTIFHIKGKIHGTEHTVSICFGNILKKNGAIIIGINNQLETKKENISKLSLHGQLIREHEDDLIKLFSKQKINLSSLPVEFGTFYKKDINKKKYIFLVMSELMSQNNAKTKFNYVKQAISSMFGKFAIGEQLTVDTVYCPLLGMGAADMIAKNIDLIKLLIRLYVISCNKSTGIKKFKICIYWKDIAKLKVSDFWEIKKYLKFACSNCIDCEK